MNRSGRRKLSFRLAVLFVAATALGPAAVRAQSVQELEEKIERLEDRLRAFEEFKRQLSALKEQLRKVREEQRARAEKQEKAAADLKIFKHAVESLSKIELSGNATGILQGTAGLGRFDGGDEGFAAGSFDLVFTHKPLENVRLMIDLEGVSGDGPDSKFPTLSGLNDDAGSTGGNVTVLEAWVETILLGGRLTLTAGKIDLTNYVDTNAFANDETAQFLSSAFVNNAVLSAPENGPGVRARLVLISDLLYVEAGGMSQDPDGNGRTTDRLFDEVYGVVEVGLTPKIFGRQGNYRVWAFADGAGRRRSSSGRIQDFTALGIGASADQELAEWLGVFFRIGHREAENLAYNTRTAWSAGVQITGPLPFRRDDLLGVAYGQVRPTKRDAGLRRVKDERLIEGYYQIVIAEGFHLSLILQSVMNRGGNPRASDFVVLGARLQLDF